MNYQLLATTRRAPQPTQQGKRLRSVYAKGCTAESSLFFRLRRVFTPYSH